MSQLPGAVITVNGVSVVGASQELRNCNEALKANIVAMRNDQTWFTLREKVY